MKGRITENFRLDELASRGELPVLTPDIIEFAQMTQELRDWAAATYPDHARNGLILSNWWRSEKHNRDVGGSSNSIHLDARAMDITNVKPSTFKEFAAVWHSICLRHGKIGGINFYNWGIHIDDFEDKFGSVCFKIRDYR